MLYPPLLLISQDEQIHTKMTNKLPPHSTVITGMGRLFSVILNYLNFKSFLSIQTSFIHINVASVSVLERLFLSSKRLL